MQRHDPKGRLLALDIDGTLLTSSGQLTDRTSRAVRRLKTQGWTVCLVSGRRPRKMHALARVLDLTAPLAAYNGGVIAYPGSSVPLRSSSLNSSVAGPVLAAWETEGISYFIYRGTNDGPDVYYSHLPSWLPAMHYVKSQGPYVAPISSLSGRRQWDPRRLVVMASQGTARRAQQVALPHLVPGKSRDYLMEYGTSWCYEIYPPVSKRDALHFLCQHCNITRSEAVAVGDNVNDREMLSSAGLGVAMGNATRTVKEVADLVIGHHDEDGLACFLETLD